MGRDDEMIVSGGENVYPLEVEQTLGEHEDVVEAAVIGVDDEKFGQRLDAYVVLQPGAAATPDDLKQHVKQHLAGYKVPRELVVLDDLPRNDTGKVMKRQLGGSGLPCVDLRGRRRAVGHAARRGRRPGRRARGRARP